MSVNDDLPWIAPELTLIRQAVANNIPMLGHCLGGQLISKALGGVVSKNPVKEIGWGEISVADNPVAREWFGELSKFKSFHWHGEAFSLPDGATRVLSSPYCENQAFTLGMHLGMQCHVEMTEDMVKTWCQTGAEEIARQFGTSGTIGGGNTNRFGEPGVGIKSGRQPIVYKMDFRFIIAKFMTAQVLRVTRENSEIVAEIR